MKANVLNKQIINFNKWSVNTFFTDADSCLVCNCEIQTLSQVSTSKDKNV